jgi:hypothetical protein
VLIGSETEPLPAGALLAFFHGSPGVFLSGGRSLVDVRTFSVELPSSVAPKKWQLYYRDFRHKEQDDVNPTKCQQL